MAQQVITKAPSSTSHSDPVLDVNYRVSQLLRKADEDVKLKKYEHALTLVRNVYQVDARNMYARAYEERILALKLEEERDLAIKDVQRKADERIETELKRRMTEFYKNIKLEALRKKKADSNDQVLEEGARKASLTEQQETVQKGISALEANMKRSLEELGRRLALQVHQGFQAPGVPVMGDIVTSEQVRTQYESDLSRIKQQFADAEAARKAIQDETFVKMREENDRARRDLMAQMEEQRSVMQQRESSRLREITLNAYHSLLEAMGELGVQQSLHEPLLHAMRVPFALSEDEHLEFRRKAHISLFASVLRGAWRQGKPSDEDLLNLKSLQEMYGISDLERQALTKAAKKDLGLPDEDAVILVVDDDPVVQKFIGHILRQTYKTVLTATSVNEAIDKIRQCPPMLVLCDLHLGPDSISGVTFYEKLHAGEHGDSLRRVSFILMSALRDEFFVKSAKQIGINMFLPKPLTKEVLERTVHEVLHGQVTSDESESATPQ